MMKPTGGLTAQLFCGYTMKAVYILTIARLHSHPSPFPQQAWLAHMPSLCTALAQKKKKHMWFIDSYAIYNHDSDSKQLSQL